MMRLGYLVADPFRLTPEEEAGWRYLLGRQDVRNVLLPFDAIARRAPAVDLYWWHTDRQDRLPPAARPSEIGEQLVKHVRGGAGLLLTLQAARFVTDLGVESVPPNRTVFEPWSEESWARGYPDIRGIGGFLGHPVFEGLGGGAWLWAPRRGTPFSAAYYQSPARPAQGNVVGVGRRYIRLDEGTILCTEYRKGRGTILAVGAFTVFADPANPFRACLEHFIGNCIRHVGGGARTGTNTTYWPGASGGATHAHAPPGRPLRPQAESPPRSSGLQIEKPAGPDTPFDLGGRRVFLLGTERGRLDEVWTGPFRSFSGVRIGLRHGDGPLVPLETQQTALTVRPESLGGRCRVSGAAVEWTLFADRQHPGGAIVLRLECTAHATVHASFATDHRLMWPIPDGAAGPMQYAWSAPLGAALFSSPESGLTSVCGSPTAPSRVMMGPFPGFMMEGGQLRPELQRPGVAACAMTFTLAPGTHTLTFAFSGSHRSPGEATQTYRRLAESPHARLGDHARAFRRLPGRTVAVTTGNREFDESYRWAAVSLARSHAETPGVGKGLLAGFGGSGKGWDGGHRVSGRPGYGWYFGRDSVWTGFALLALGEFRMVRDQLALLGAHQSPTGKILHELTASGHAHYDAADSTPLYVTLMDRYLLATGDRAFVCSQASRVRAAIAYCRSTDTDADGLIENTAGGHGWIEGGPLHPIHVEHYLACCWGSALDAASRLARVWGDGAAARSWAREGREVRERIEGLFWDSDGGFYKAGIAPDGTPIRERTILPAAGASLGQVPPDRLEGMVREWDGGAFSTPWGVRLVRRDSPHYNPSGYHYGSIWPLFTGWAALASYAAGNGRAGFAHLQRNAGLFREWSAGCFPEVMHGEERRPGGVCHRQAWSAAMTLLPALEGMLGIRTDVPARTLSLAPQLPDELPAVSVKNIRVGRTAVALDLRRDADGLVCLLVPKGPPVQVRLVIPAGCSTRRSSLGVAAAGHAVPFRFSPGERTLLFRLAKETRVTLRSVHSPRASP